MADVFFPRIVQTDVLFYDAVDISGVTGMMFYFRGGGLRIELSNNGGVTSDSGTYEEVTAAILSGVPFAHTFSTTGQVLRMRLILDGGTTLYSPNINGAEQDYLWQGQVVRV